jgi:exo-beta-1,3-glucanase (GH17 family)
MPFNSNTARVAGQKSKRGKAKYTTEIRDKLNNLTDYLIQVRIYFTSKEVCDPPQLRIKLASLFFRHRLFLYP